MNERETERRLRDWLDVQALPAVPDELRRSIAAIPMTVPTTFPERLAATLGLRQLAYVPSVAWILLLTGLLLALVVGAPLVGSDLFQPTPAVLRSDVAPLSTGIKLITPDHGAYSRVVADGSGILWAEDPDGRLVRYDPASTSGQSWTVSDDASLGTTDIAGSRAGGVWLIGAGDVRRFDGRVFREVIATPGEVSLLAEAPDAGLWAVMTDGRLAHWDGSSWSNVDAGRPASKPASGRITALAVDAAGRPWLGWTVIEEAAVDADGAPAPSTAPTAAPATEAPGTSLEEPSAVTGPSGWVARRDGSAWSTWDERASAPLGAGVATILPTGNGPVWVITTTGLARFDGTSWSDMGAGLAEGPCPSGWSCPRLVSWAEAPDGAIWAAGEGLDGGDNEVIVRRFDGTAWAGWDSADGLPSHDLGRHVPGSLPWSGLLSATVMAVPSGTFVGTADGIYGLADGRWDRVWPPEAAPAGGLAGLLPISRDELWAFGDPGVWHFDRGAWTSESIGLAYAFGLADLALAPDGTIWAAGIEGVAYRRDGRWIVVDPTPALGVAAGPDGTVWVVGRDDSADPPCHLWTLRSSGARWVRTAIDGGPQEKEIWTVAVDGRGATWVGGAGRWIGDGPGLARYADGRWRTMDDIGGTPAPFATILGTTAAGDLWVVVPDGAARFDGTAWQVIPPPGEAAGEYALGSDGSLWVALAGEDGSTRIAHLEGGRWNYPYPRLELPLTSVAVAPDGTVFAVGSAGSTVLRLPAR